MMKRLSMTLASLFLFIGIALAQTTVKGTVVTYEDNEPIIGASIQVVGATNIGTITDVNGQFTLEVPAGKKTLKITYVGMEPGGCRFKQAPPHPAPQRCLEFG